MTDDAANRPLRRPRLPVVDRGRVLLIGAFVVLLVVVVSARFIANFYVDLLWHRSLGRTDVFWGMLRSKVVMLVLFGGAFIVPAVLNLTIADRLAPATFSANTHPVVERFHDLFGRRMRTVRIGVAVALGLLFAAPAVAQWDEWLMFRNARNFGIDDPQYGNDIGFYLFRLPFIAFSIDWLFAAVLLMTLMVLATHVLNGGIVMQAPRPKVRKATKAHLAVLLAVLAVIKAADYWVARYELTTEQRGVVHGATYAVDKAQRPAVVLLALVALLAAGLFVSTLKTNSWKWPGVVCALWVVVALLGGVVYPAAVQKLLVEPNQRDKEAPYIERNVLATRQALGIDNVIVEPVSVSDVTTSALQDDVDSLRNVRLLDPVKMLDRFRVDEGQQAGLAIHDLDVDRYDIDGEQRQVLLGALELNLATVANRSWQGQHLISTHGCGVAFAPAGQVMRGSKFPNYLAPPGLERPELYFSDQIDGYAIVGTSVTEQPCRNQTNAGQYEGRGGVQLNSTLRRVAYALHYLDYNIIGSSAVGDDARLLSIRSVGERVRELAPFLRYDSDPYPVVSEGRVQWIIDAYTTSARYPYGQSAELSQLSERSGLTEPLNYVRNSVKAVVDSYDGDVTFYVVDEADPMLHVWSAAFPKLFTPLADMPADLRSHLRYPEDLFRLQTAAYSKYQLAPDQFFDDRNLAWSVAEQPPQVISGNNLNQAPVSAPPTTVGGGNGTGAVGPTFTVEATGQRIAPYYSMFTPPGSTDSSFQLLRPFTPFSGTNALPELQAYMTAGSDVDNYGQLIVYRVTDTALPPGPITALRSMIASLSQNVTLSQRQLSVELGTMQLIPIGDGLLWVCPLYVASAANNQPTLELVLVSHAGQAAFGDSIEEVIDKLFPRANLNVGDVVGGRPTAEEPDTPGPDEDRTAEELLAAAAELFEDADAAIANGDFGLYDQKIEEARDLVAQALVLLSNEG